MALGNVTGVNINNDTITISVGSDQLIVQACKPEILRVDYQPSGRSSADTQVIDPNKTWTIGNIASIDTVSDPMVITTKKMIVKISKSPCRISVYNLSNKLIIQEQGNGGVYSGGVKLSHDAADNFYGIGEDGSVLKNNGGSVYAGNQGHSGAPFVWSNNGYGVLVDSDGGKFLIASSTLEFSNVSKIDTEFYIMVGKPADIMSALAEISGKPPMFPKWAMGFTNTEWGITESELTSIVDTYRSKEIPIDNYCLDFDWKKWGEDNYGDFIWNTTKFPSSASGTLKSAMAAKGIKLTGILKPRIHTGTVQATDVTNGGWWLPGSSPYTDYCSGKLVRNIDFSQSGLRTWYFNHLKAAFDNGIVGWWNDEADVDFDNWGHFNMEKCMYEGQRAYKNQRVWSISRNFYLGAQRYAYGMWTGDINTGFDSMSDQRRRLIGSLNLGLVKWGMDTGGFIGDPSPENYARWIQFSAFTPIFRVHGQENKQRQPWKYGTTAEAAAKKVMQLRYQLIPYIYSYERQAYETGVGLVKPLVFDYPSDSNVASYKDAWMFGDHMLVSPVVDQGQTAKSIYLPAGTWIDYFKGTKYTGGQTISYQVDSATWADVPLFIKKGAIIPSQDFVNYVGEKTIATIYVDVFPDTQETSFKYYDDDGETYDYESGEYFVQTMTAKADTNSATFTLSSQSGSFTPDVKYYLVKLHFDGATTVKINGNAVTQYSNSSALQSAAGEGWATGRDIYGTVFYVKVAAGSAKSIVAAIKEDIDPPTAPTNLQSTKQTGNTISLSWTASTDDVAVVGYQVFRDGVRVTSSLVQGTTYTDMGLTVNTTYQYNVIAQDTAGHLSTASNTISTTTGSIKDLPAPTNLQATGETKDTVSLSWTASTDASVIGYEIYRDNTKVSGGSLVIGTTYIDTGLAAETSYSYYVVAKDAAGKASPASNEIKTTTKPETSKTTIVTFTINNATTYWGQNVYITGNIAELSNWSPANAKGPASCPNYPNWTITLELPAGQAIEFKSIKKDGSGNVVWEGGNNHTYTVPTSDTGNVTINWQN